MARKNTTVAAPVANVNRSQLIRDYHAANPTASMADIAKALTEQGHKVSTTLASQVISGRKSGSKGKGLSVESIKAAGQFVKSYKGKIADAKAAIGAVGAFIEECGSSDNALAALVSFEEVAASMK